MATTKIVLDLQSDLVLTNPNITAPIGLVKGDISGLVLDLASIDTAATAEASTRLANDNTIAANLSSEIVNRAADVDAEETRATSAELVLTNNLSSEIVNRVADVNAEESRATSAELVLTNNLSSELIARAAGDTALDGKITTEKGRIDSILLASDADKDSFAEIVTLINSVDTTNDQAFAGYVLSNNSALSTELSTRLAADGSLDTKVGVEKTRAEAAELVLTNDLSSEVANRIADVNAEESRATSAELVLTQGLSSELVARANGDTSLETKITSDISAVNSSNIAADASLTTRVSSEESTRLANDNTIAANLSSEIVNRVADVDAEQSRANAAELVLTNNLSSEVSDRIADVNAEESRALAAELVLTSGLSSELVARASADLVLTNGLSSEIVNRVADVDAEQSRSESAELVLRNNLSTELLVRASADLVLTQGLSSELIARAAGDTALDGKITTEKGRIDSILLASDADKDSFAEIVTLINSVDTANDTAFAGYVLSNNSALSVELSTRLAADGSLDTKVGDEKTRAEAAELILTNGLASEITNRTADVNAEESRALAAELVLTQGLSSELVARASADLLLTNGLSSEIMNRVADVDAEESRALAAELSLTTRVAAEESTRLVQDNLLDGRIVNIVSNTNAPLIDSFSEVVSTTNTALAGVNTNSDSFVKSNRPKVIAFNETINGTRKVFTASVIIGTEMVFLNGLMQTVTNDYSISNNEGIVTVEFNSAPRLGSKINLYGVAFSPMSINIATAPMVTLGSSSSMPS